MTDTKEKKYMLGIYDRIFKEIMLNKDNIEYLKRLISFMRKKCYNKSNKFEKGNTFEKYCLILKEENNRR